MMDDTAVPTQKVLVRALQSGLGAAPRSIKPCCYASSPWDKAPYAHGIKLQAQRLRYPGNHLGCAPVVVAAAVVRVQQHQVPARCVCPGEEFGGHRASRSHGRSECVQLQRIPRCAHQHWKRPLASASHAIHVRPPPPGESEHLVQLTPIRRYELTWSLYLGSRPESSDRPAQVPGTTSPRSL